MFQNSLAKLWEHEFLSCGQMQKSNCKHAPDLRVETHFRVYLQLPSVQYVTAVLHYTVEEKKIKTYCLYLSEALNFAMSRLGACGMWMANTLGSTTNSYPDASISIMCETFKINLKLKEEKVFESN